MAEFICAGEKYEVGGPKLDTIGLPVVPQGLPPTLEVEGYMLTLKTKFHVSLIAIGQIIKKKSIEDLEFQNNVIADFCQFVQTNPVDLLRYRDEYRFMQEEEKRSVVVMCDISNLDKFFDHLNTVYNLKLEYPPTHATLYTLQPNVGIFMTDSDDMQRLTKVIPSPAKL